jgi:hypothetical protein
VIMTNGMMSESTNNTHGNIPWLVKSLLK